jgi:hypothetical protein
MVLNTVTVDGTTTIKEAYRRLTKTGQKQLINDYRRIAQNISRTEYLIICGYDGKHPPILLDGYHRFTAFCNV